MILIERSGRVEAPIDTVWEVVGQAALLPDWLAGVRQAEVIGTDTRRMRVHTADGAAAEAEVIEFQPPKLIAWRERAAGPGIRAEARTEVQVELTPEGDGTAVRLTVVRWPAGQVSATLLRLGKHRVGADLETSLGRLSDLAAARHSADVC
ncbi:SRPBCC family protein [Solwaraspora sp. WMMD791]|uniref:SRPBCC family protein n=1 Tax=unclassified Solwaraspora TaxID=2627926 RepID=UPI00249BFDC7|nr:MULTISPECIES: SRPBCC family protein [unclassified Solwaraspora]WFE29662.1 SRPBCC family protein [Solwaraspora sp. WMMD791]WJK43492.1 SRPBCC family protein [Solwaraspora sp. WMMA2056]